MEKDEFNNDRNKVNAWVKYSQIGLQMLVTIAGGSYLGHWLDGKMAMKIPVWTLCLSLFSIGVALYLVIKQLPNQ